MIELTQTDRDGCRILSTRGELDMQSSPQLLESVRTALKGSAVLKIDLSEVKYVDSSGIAVLIQGYKTALKKSVKYLLLNPSSQVMSVIKLSQLEDFFTIEHSGEEE